MDSCLKQQTDLGVGAKTPVSQDDISGAKGFAQAVKELNIMGAAGRSEMVEQSATG
jgi:hypothetical protein